MMLQPIDYIFEQIEVLNPVHIKKLKKNMAFFDKQYHEHAGVFFEKYTAILKLENKTLDDAIHSYLQMIADVNNETIEFLRSGKYTSSSFAEVNERVYAKPGVMEYYMHGLIMSQFLWKHHYQMFHYFITTFPHYTKAVKSYLEVGVGHGFYLSKVLDLVSPETLVNAVDISETSITMARRFIGDSRIDFKLKDIFEVNDLEKYDFITLGEVLEHVEDPLALLLKLNSLLSENGMLFFTTPTNAPAIDHIYLFNNVSEIQELVRRAGFQIESERSFLSEDVSPEKVAKFKISVLYGAFLKKITR